MIKKEIKIELAKGLEARPVAVFVQVASQFDSSIFVEYRDKRVNAKSIMGMMSLNILPGKELRVITKGNDEQQAMDEIEAYLTARASFA
jgi:phosphotransferase system HPr (HPr) family protein